MLPGCRAELDPTGRYVLDLEQLRRVQQQDGIALSPEQLAALAPLEATPAPDGGLPATGSLVLEGGRFTMVLSHHGRESRRTGTVVVRNDEFLLQGTSADSSDHQVQYRVRLLDQWLHLFVDAGDVPRLIFRRESH